MMNKSHGKTLVFFLALLTLINAYNPIIAWTQSDLGSAWKPGTEINEPISSSQLTTIFKDLIATKPVWLSHVNSNRMQRLEFTLWTDCLRRMSSNTFNPSLSIPLS